MEQSSHTEKRRAGGSPSDAPARGSSPSGSSSGTSLPHIEVAAGILWRDQRFLAARRAKRPMSEYWEFPGGKLEPEETPLQALTRELKEELDIDVQKAVEWQILEHTYEDARIHVRIYFFHVTAYTGEPRGVEGQTLSWLSVTEAMQLPFLPADQPILTRLGSLRLLHPMDPTDAP